MSKLNALHPALVVIENPGEYLDASMYPANIIKISSSGGGNINLFLNVLQNNTKQWVLIGDNEGGGGASIDGLNDEIVNRIAADTELRNLITSLVSQEQTNRAASDAEISQAIETLDDRVDSVENSVSGVQSGLSTVQNNVSTLQSSVSNMQTSIASKADAQDVSTLQSSVSNMQTSIAGKADAQDVAIALESKANSADVADAIAGKADARDVNWRIMSEEVVTDQVGAWEANNSERVTIVPGDNHTATITVNSTAPCRFGVDLSAFPNGSVIHIIMEYTKNGVAGNLESLAMSDSLSDTWANVHDIFGKNVVGRNGILDSYIVKTANKLYSSTNQYAVNDVIIITSYTAELVGTIDSLKSAIDTQQDSIDDLGARPVGFSNLYIPSAYTYEQYMTMTIPSGYSGQGSAVYENYFVQGYSYAAENKISIYNISTKQKIGDFPLTGITNTRTHANTLSFGVEKYDEADDFPLLYIASGYTDTTSSVNGEIYVCRIASDGEGGYVASVVQTITIVNEDVNLWSEGFVDRDNSRLWIKCYHNNKLHFAYVALPTLSQGDVIINISELTNIYRCQPWKGLVASSPQNHTYYKGFIICASGVPTRASEGPDSCCIAIYDTLAKCALVGRIWLNAIFPHTSSAEEPEGVHVINDVLYVAYRKKLVAIKTKLQDQIDKLIENARTNTDMDDFIGPWKSGNDTHVTVEEGANHAATITVLDNASANRTRAFLDLSKIANGSKLHIEMHYTLNGGTGAAPKLYGIDAFDMAGTALVDVDAGGDIAGVDGVYIGTFIKGNKHIAFNNITFAANDVLEITSLSITKIDTVSQLSMQTAELNSYVEGIEEDLSDLETIKANAEDKAVTRTRKFLVVGAQSADWMVNKDGDVVALAQYNCTGIFDNASGHRFKMTSSGNANNGNYYVVIAQADTLPSVGETVEVLYSYKYAGNPLSTTYVTATKRYLIVTVRRVNGLTGFTIQKEDDYVTAITAPYKEYNVYLNNLGRRAQRGFLSPDGTFNAYSGDYYVTDYIDVRGIDYVQYIDGISKSVNYPDASSIWYNSAKEVVGILGCLWSTAIQSNTPKKIAKVPEGVAYVRFSYNSTVAKTLKFFTKAGYERSLMIAKCTKYAETPTYASNFPLGILHISDIHGDTDALNRIQNLMGAVGIWLPNTLKLMTGDVAEYYADSTTSYPNGAEWWKSSQLAEQCFLTIGNHDGATDASTEFDEKEASAAWDGKGKSWEFDNYYAPFISKVGYEMPIGYDDPESPNYKAMYWKKDFATQKIRVIGLDCIHRFDGILDPATGEIQSAGFKHLTNEQELWLISTLNETLDSNNDAYGYSVIVCGHYPLDDFDGINNETNTKETGGIVYSERSGYTVNFNHSGDTGSLTLGREFNWRNRVATGGSPSFSKGTVNNVGNIIETWRAAGGNFICFLCGHTHVDYMFYPTKFPNLLCINLTQAGFKRNSPAIMRNPDFEDYISFNYITFNPSSTNIKITKFGYNVTSTFKKMERLSYNYATRRVLVED